MFTSTDIQQIEQKGIQLSKIEEQICNFRKGFPFMKLLRPATVGDGIIILTEDKIKEVVENYSKRIEYNLQPVKFVPASGAASRMFQSLFSFLEAACGESGSGSSSGNKPAERMPVEDKFKDVKQFFGDLPSFAFYDELEKGVGGIKDEEGQTKYCEILNFLLSDKGLNYGFLPKGLLKFHQYPEGSRTPVEEHMIEGALYGSNSKGEVKLHFTVSPEHREYFMQKTAAAAKVYESKFGVKYDISFSEQKASTDTIAVDPDNNPFRKADGSLLFRPGGHGALLDNLNDIKGDIIFIKNIDNVVPDLLKKDTVLYKKALAGLLLHYQEKIFNYLQWLETDPEFIPDEKLDEIAAFIEKDLYTVHATRKVSTNKMSLVHYLFTKLNRPIRIAEWLKIRESPVEDLSGQKTTMVQSLFKSLKARRSI